MKLESVRWGMIGCGDVAEVKSGPGFRRAQRSSLVAVMRRDRAKAEDYARRHGVPRAYDDARLLLADPEVDAVYVATPPSTHAAYTQLAAAAGKPVYVEKPMALDHAECRAMIDACARAAVPLFVAYYRRALPRFVKIKELLESGAIGDVRTVSVCLRQPPDPSHTGPQRPWRVVPALAGGGLFVDMACHTLDLLDWFLGPVARATGAASNEARLHDADDLLTAHLRFASGVHGVGSWCFSSSDRADRTEIVGSRGTIAFATFAEAPVRVIVGEEVTEHLIPHPPHVQEPLIQSVVDELTGRGRCPSPAESAARTSAVMDAILGRDLPLG